MWIHGLYILFLFALGACVGSFLNVVVWRLPRVMPVEGESLGQSLWRSLRALTFPGSHCPRCLHPLAWHDNIPVFGWIMLRGRCRYCQAPIAMRYPIVETVTGLLFVFYYVALFIWQTGPCAPFPAPASGYSARLAPTTALFIARDWPIYLMYMVLVSGLLAASLIDAELFIIPTDIPWFLALVGIIGHALIDAPNRPGALSLSPLPAYAPPGWIDYGPATATLAFGAALGLIFSIAALLIGWMPASSIESDLVLEVDRQRDPHASGAVDNPPRPEPAHLRRQMFIEFLFLLPPILLAGFSLAIYLAFPSAHPTWHALIERPWISGLLGAVNGAMIGGLMVWITRILGTLGFGRLAMGLGDVHLMFGVGAILGAAAVTYAFFLAPFCGLAVAVWMIFTGKRRELPYGPYLSIASAVVLILQCPISNYLAPGTAGLVSVMRSLVP